MKENKHNSIKDFISCAEFLISEEITKSRLMAAWTSSAGAIVVGTAINNYPELFKCAVLDVPFVDLLSLMLDPELPLTIPEYEE